MNGDDLLGLAETLAPILAKAHPVNLAAAKVVVARRTLGANPAIEIETMLDGTGVMRPLMRAVGPRRASAIERAAKERIAGLPVRSVMITAIHIRAEVLCGGWSSDRDVTAPLPAALRPAGLPPATAHWTGTALGVAADPALADDVRAACAGLPEGAVRVLHLPEAERASLSAQERLDVDRALAECPDRLAALVAATTGSGRAFAWSVRREGGLAFLRAGIAGPSERRHADVLAASLP